MPSNLVLSAADITPASVESAALIVASVPVELVITTLVDDGVDPKFVLPDDVFT